MATGGGGGGYVDICIDMHTLLVVMERSHKMSQDIKKTK